MAYTRCTGFLGADIAPDCENPQKLEFTGEGVIFSKTVNAATIYTLDPNNRRMIEQIELHETPDDTPTSYKVYIVDNLMREPFSGANIALNTEDGRPTYDMSLPIRIPKVSAESAKDIVEPLSTDMYLGIFPTTNGRYIVFGMYGKWNASDVSWNPSENGSDAVATMTSNEPYFIVEAMQAVYDDLRGKAVSRV